MFKKHNRNKKGGVGEDEDFKSLFVFGYSCRLYAPKDLNDADQLIPWNGDENLKIDRYDCRLYLNNLAEFEALRNVETEGDLDFSMEERLEEELCEEERYLAMYDDIRKAEEGERLKRGRGAEIAFSYNQDLSTSTLTAESSSSEEEIEEPYVVPEGLKLPVGIDLPETMKQSAIIERTASFVVSKGPQMEIVIKAKQRNDASHFGFLEFDNRLNSFYKYICKLIREKKYTPSPSQPKTRPKPKKLRRLEQERNQQEAKSANVSHALKMIAMHHGSGSEEEEEQNSDDEKGDGYLHPLLRVKAAGGSGSLDSSIIIENSGPSIGPMPRPANPPPNFDEIFSQLQDQMESTDNVYSSLFKNLNSIIPSKSTKVEDEIPEDDADKNKEVESTEEFTPEIVHETDEAKIKEYNEWYLSFYNNPSPYLPKGPPIPLPPPPNLSSALGIAARYVAMNGGLAEQRLIDHNGEGCSFLFPQSPYYTYYQSRVRQTQWTLSQAYLKTVSSADQEKENIITSTPSLDYPDPPRPPKCLTVEKAGPVPTELKVNELTTNENTSSMKEDDENSAEVVLKRERKERARLFMEKILNEKLAAKKRQREGNNPVECFPIREPNDDTNGKEIPASTSFTNAKSFSVSPNISSSRISELINEKIQHVFTSSPLLAPVATNPAREHQDASPAIKKGKTKRENEREKKHESRHRSRERHRKRSRSPSKSSSTDNDEDRRRHEKRSKRHRSSKKHSSRRRSRSSSYYRRRSRSRS